MPENAARRGEIERLRRRAERHRQVALGLGAEDDARAAQAEAEAVEREVAKLEAELREVLGETNVLLHPSFRRPA